MISGSKHGVSLSLAAMIALLLACVPSFAANEIEIRYRAPNKPEIVRNTDARESVFISEPGEWNGGVSTWSVQVRALSARTTTSVGTIFVSGDTNDDITLFVMNEISNQTLSTYAVNNGNGIWLDTNSDLTIKAYIYGNLTGNIFHSHAEYRPIKQITLFCAGTITANRLIKGVHVEFVRAHKIEGGVTVEAVAGTNSKIRLVRTGYVDGERSGVSAPPGGWPTMGAMDIGTSGSPLTLRTPSGVDLTQSVVSMDDLYVILDIGGHTTELRNAPQASGEAFNYSSGTLTHRMQVTGETATLGNVYASADSGGYLDTASDYLYITSSTTDYAGTMASVSGASGANEIDFRGRIWFNAGIAAATVIRLSDDMNGEMIFNAANNERLWSTLSDVLIDGTNVSEENPDDSLVTSGGGTIGMVDGVGNDLGFHLHLEACFPPSGSGGSNEIFLANWKTGDEWIDLVFYGPIRLEGDGPHVDLQWFDPQSEEWVTGGACAFSSLEVLLYDLLPSGANTSLNVLELTRCPICPCVTPLGEYRIIEKTDGLKSDLGLQDDPDVQPFTYYFTLVE